MTGSNHAHPIHGAQGMETSLRWAISSAQETDQPVLTSFVLPHSPNSRTAYTRWLPHPMVQEIVIMKESPLRLKDPRHWSSRKNSLSGSSCDMRFLIVANTAGLQSFLRQGALQRGFAAAAIDTDCPGPQINQLRTSINDKVRLQGLYPPKHCAKARTEAAGPWSTTELPQDASLYDSLEKANLQPSTMHYKPEEIMSTDGSKRDIAELGTVTGLGVFR